MKQFLQPWASGILFKVSAGVLYNGVGYFCTTEHTSTSTFDSGKFRLLVAGDNFTSPVRDSFYRENFIAVDAVFLGIPNAQGQVTQDSVLRLCSGGIDVKIADLNGTLRTYTAQGDFLGFDSVTEEFDVKVGKFNIYLSGLGSGMVDRWLDKDFEGKQVQIVKCFLNYEDLSLLGAHIVFDGIIYNVKIVESAVTCTISIECSTLWADFERNTGRMTNNNSNWLFQQGNTSDTCFAKTGTVGNVEFLWGRTTK